MTAESFTQKLIFDEALRRGWHIENQSGKYYDVVDNRGRRVHFTLSRPGTSASNGVRMAIDKIQTMRIIEEMGYRVAPFTEYAGPGQAEAFLEEHTNIVVKPNDGEKSLGITTKVSTPDALEAGFRKAMMNSQQGRVMLQKQLEGREYRLLVIGDMLFAASYRRPAQVAGDGVHTISELVERVNEDRLQKKNGLELINLLPLRELLGPTKLDEVPDKGEIIRLSDLGGMSAGGETIDVTGQVHDDYKKIAVMITRRAELTICGLDILTDDISKTRDDYLPLLEINSSPGFKPHMLVSEGTSRDPAPVLLDEVFGTAKRKR